MKQIEMTVVLKILIHFSLNLKMEILELLGFSICGSFSHIGFLHIPGSWIQFSMLLVYFVIVGVLASEVNDPLSFEHKCQFTLLIRIMGGLQKSSTMPPLNNASNHYYTLHCNGSSALKTLQLHKQKMTSLSRVMKRSIVSVLGVKYIFMTT